MNVNIEIVFCDFLKNDFLELRSYDLYGSVIASNKFAQTLVLMLLMFYSGRTQGDIKCLAKSG